MKEIYEYKIESCKQKLMSNSLYEARSSVKSLLKGANKIDSDVTIMIQGYNHLEKTKQCVESVLKYTKNVNYDLLLVDNGSTDGTFEYFKSIDYDKVRIVRISQNIISSFPFLYIDLNWISNYFVPLANDIIVTENWLSNMITIAESDMRIGMVNPVSSNVSNNQNVDLHFNNLEDMQKKAAKYNCSNPAKWHEKLRLITLGTLYTKECLLAMGFPHLDLGFFHDFGDDDITFRVRRAGYKAVLAKDTWVHHNHDVFHLENKDPEEFQKSLDTGRQNFKDKYYGVDAWDDVNNYIYEIVPKIKAPSDTENCRILGVDVKCGTPILEIKNHLRSYGVIEPICCAVTSEGKYVIDLQTVCGAENVFACSPENAFGYLPMNFFDYIVIGNNINEYSEPYKIIKTVYALLKKNAQMFFYLKNTYDIYSFLNVIGHRGIRPASYAYNITVEAFVNDLNNMNMSPSVIGAIPYTKIPNEYVDEINKRGGMFVKEDLNGTELRLKADKFAFLITK